MITQLKFVGIPTKNQDRALEFVSEPQSQPWGEFAIFKDPDGNKFVLSSS